MLPNSPELIGPARVDFGSGEEARVSRLNSRLNKVAPNIIQSSNTPERKLSALVVEVASDYDVLSGIERRKVVSTDNRRLRNSLGVLLVSIAFRREVENVKLEGLSMRGERNAPSPRCLDH